MCGRYRLSGPIHIERDIQPFTAAPLAAVSDEARRMLSLDLIHRPYNDVPVIFMDREGDLRITSMYWQLIHYWCDTFESKYTNFNTRVESLPKKHNRELLARHRCLLPSTGFFETRKDVAGVTFKPREAYEFTPAAGGLLMLGGVYSVWRNPKDPGDIRPSCSIITMEPNRTVGEVHPRMPFLVPEDICPSWLDRGLSGFDDAMSLIAPVGSESLVRTLEKR